MLAAFPDDQAGADGSFIVKNASNSLEARAKESEATH
jgi:hypothetical protein